ncbi:MAG: 1,4-dihydroxy-2-naphthoate polyprenyltransferase [Candidatus Hydrogenedens sp.]|nr:1,4-dihydroxy-2-naphthoate polyprenyltransferase [Candidatus Hydrogenedens sp.]
MASQSFQAWLLAARPKTLAAGITPVLIGAALAWSDGVFHGPAALAAALGALLIQIGTNYANDYFDFVKGTDTEERVGPKRMTQAGLVTPAQMRAATALVFALAFIPGAYLVYRGGWPILALGLVSILCGVLYTGGPYPLGYLGLGDIFVLFFFGPVAVGGTYYVQAQTLPLVPLLAGLAPGLFSTAILTVNNLRDADTDVKTGKRTLAVRLGKPFARAEYVVTLLLGAIGVPVGLWLYSGQHRYALAACLVVLPAIPAIRTVMTSSDPAKLNDILAGTGKLLLLFSVLFSIGWVL